MARRVLWERPPIITAQPEHDVSDDELDEFEQDALDDLLDEEEDEWTDEDEAALDEYEEARRRRIAEANEY